MIHQNTPPILHDVTTIIPTLGRPLLEGCLYSIAAGSAWPARLIVVDQGDNPQVAGWVNDLKSRGLIIDHIKSSQRGISAAINRGLERVETSLVTITHDDCRVDPEWLQSLAAQLRKIPGTIITGKAEPEGEGIVPSTFFSSIPATYNRPLLERDPLIACNMGFAFTVVQSVGFFNEDPRLRLAAEDAEWSYRALKLGIPIVYTPKATVRHVAWRESKQLATTYRRYALSRGAFYGIYIRRGDRFIARRAVFDLLRAPWWWLRGVVTKNSDLAGLGRAWVIYLLPGIITGLQREPLA